MHRILAAAIAVVFVAMAAIALFVLPAGGSTKHSPTVLLTVPGGHGSGVVLPGGYILTAAHVAVMAPKGLTVSTESGDETSDVETLWTSPIYDIALLKINDRKFLKKVGSADLVCEEVPVGTSVTSEGNPLSIRFVVNEGRIGSRPQEIGHWKVAVTITAGIAPGMSGGPVFDAAGRVVGINVGIATGLSIYVIVPSFVACDLMGRGEKWVA